MRILFTGDWQFDATNLHLAKMMVRELVAICDQKRVDAIVNLGDVKERYSPIDGKVLNFAIRSTSILSKRRPYYVLLGNHDRYGMHTDINSWLPVLKKAGAKTFDTYGVETFDDSTRLFFLPFRSSLTQTRSDAEALSRKVKDPGKSILVFHQDLRRANYNVILKSDSKLRVADLHPRKYLYCIGGHIHLQQQVWENVYFAGSPYCTDMGEVNQRKGYLLVDTTTGTLTKIESAIPRFFDPRLPGFDKTKPKDWTGSTIRVRVPVWKTENIKEKLDEVRRKYERDCVGAHIIVLPILDSRTPDSPIDLDTPEDEKVKRYVEKSCPRELVDSKYRLQEYLIYRLREDKEVLRQKQKITFVEASGKNFLSYKKIDIKFKPGITLVTGENKDWIRRSNGSGKTSLLQLPAVALFGCTFKGQKHDHWARRSTKHSGNANLKLRTSDGRFIFVSRGRRPSYLRIDVEGRDESRDNKRKADQSEIERITGYTWETLGAAVYVDQEMSNGLLFGTDGERKKILERAQNLEKYTEAGKRVKEDYQTSEDFEENTQHQLELALEASRNVSESLTYINPDQTGKKRLKANLAMKKHELQQLSSREKLYRRVAVLSEAKRQVSREVTKHYKDYVLTTGDLRETYTRLKRLLSLDRICPTCEQKINQKHVQDLKKDLFVQRDSFKQKAIELETKHDEAKIKDNAIDSKIAQLNDKIMKTRDTGIQLKHDIENLEQSIARFEENDNFAMILKRKQKELNREIRVYKKALKSVAYEKVFLEYCMKVLSRSGLPSYLNSYLCPLLNKAADEYSELLSDCEIKVRFDNEEGTFIPRIVNVNGGERIKDQSKGESKMASLIASFAYRDVITPCNLLCLDEPGEGLDPVNATWFARKLKELEPKLGCVLVTSHNPSIVSELEGMKRIHVVKKRAISYVHNGTD